MNTQKSPCGACDNAAADKNNTRCKECTARVQYIHSMGPVFMPIGPEMVQRMEPIKPEISQNVTGRICVVCQTPKPLSDYYVSDKSTCKACKLERDRIRHQRKRLEKKGAETIMAEREPEIGKAGQTLCADVLQVDFTGYPHLLELLKGAARQAFRTPEMQILWLIDQADAGVPT